jgi:hypothetical protein
MVMFRRDWERVRGEESSAHSLDTWGMEGVGKNEARRQKLCFGWGQVTL